MVGFLETFLLFSGRHGSSSGLWFLLPERLPGMHRGVHTGPAAERGAWTQHPGFGAQRVLLWGTPRGPEQTEESCSLNVLIFLPAFFPFLSSPPSRRPRLRNPGAGGEKAGLSHCNLHSWEGQAVTYHVYFPFFCQRGCCPKPSALQCGLGEGPPWRALASLCLNSPLFC